MPDYEFLIEDGPAHPRGPLHVVTERAITDPYSRPTGVSDIAWTANADNTVYGFAPYAQNPRKFTQMNDLLKSVIGYSGDYVISSLRGYSGFAWPETFQDTTVALADTMGLGAVLNVKTPHWTEWRDVALGKWDDHIARFFNTWPPHVWGSFTCAHEPENDVTANEVPGVRPYNTMNPIYTEWAKIWGRWWSLAQAQIIKVAAPIIRSRNLDVKIGGCLMEYSWDKYAGYRKHYWRWWDYVHPDFHDVTEFQIDNYGDFRSNNDEDADEPLYVPDMFDQFMNTYMDAWVVGIHSWSILETAVSRRVKYTGGLEEATWQQQNDVVMDYLTKLQNIGGGRTVTYFANTDAPPTAELRGPGLVNFANLALNGNHSGWL